MRYLKCIKIFGYVNAMFLVIVILLRNMNSKTNSFVINSKALQSRKSTFRDEQINELLIRQTYMKVGLSDGCHVSEPLTDDQKDNFQKVSNELAKLRALIAPYPNDYFHGRGIVLTVGLGQLKFAKVNLKMLQLSGTRLPIQVNFICTYLFVEKYFKEIFVPGITCLFSYWENRV